MIFGEYINKKIITIKIKNMIDFFKKWAKRLSRNNIGIAVFHILDVSVQATTKGKKLNKLKIILITGKPTDKKYRTPFEKEHNLDSPITDYIQKELMANPSKYFDTFVD